MTDVTTAGLLVGPDGVPRCSWAGSAPEYLAYHDDEWGVPVHGETALFERFTLEAFQSGLSWITILRKRPAFRAAFAGFDAEQVATFDDTDRARLMADAGIVRNARKVDAAIANARAVLDLRDDGGLDAYVWSFAPEHHQPPRSTADFRATSPESVALAKGLKQRGFVFVGPDDGVRRDAGLRARRRPCRGLLPRRRDVTLPQLGTAWRHPRWDGAVPDLRAPRVCGVPPGQRRPPRDRGHAAGPDGMDRPGRQLPDVHRPVGRPVVPAHRGAGVPEAAPHRRQRARPAERLGVLPAVPVPQPHPHGPHAPRLLLGRLDAVAAARVRRRGRHGPAAPRPDRLAVHHRDGRALGEPAGRGGPPGRLHGGHGDGPPHAVPPRPEQGAMALGHVAGAAARPDPTHRRADRGRHRRGALVPVAGPGPSGRWWPPRSWPASPPSRDASCPACCGRRSPAR